MPEEENFMLTLTRDGNAVFCNGQALTINAQASKGPGKEVVYIEGLPGSNGAKWISLSKLQEGTNELHPKAQVRDGAGQKSSKLDYTLTEAENQEIAGLQKRYDEIIEAAKARYVPKPDLDVKIEDLSLDEKLAKLEEIKKYFGLE